MAKSFIKSTDETLADSIEIIAAIDTFIVKWATIILVVPFTLWLICLSILPHLGTPHSLLVPHLFINYSILTKILICTIIPLILYGIIHIISFLIIISIVRIVIFCYKSLFDIVT